MPVITTITAALLLITQQLLVLGIGRYRRAQKVGVGVGDDANLERLVRRHGNFAENAAIFVVTLGCLELLVGTGMPVLLLALAFVICRVLHLVAFSSLGGSHGQAGARGYLKIRMLGVLGTMVVGIITGIYAMVAALMTL
ncbi:MAG: MAPEG family protein [Pseudomonadota bacterium]